MAKALEIRKRAWWLKGVAHHLPDPEVATLLDEYAEEMFGKAFMEDGRLPLNAIPPTREIKRQP